MNRSKIVSHLLVVAPRRCDNVQLFSKAVPYVRLLPVLRVQVRGFTRSAATDKHGPTLEKCSSEATRRIHTAIQTRGEGGATALHSGDYHQ